MAKFFNFIVLFAMVAMASAASFGGVKDLAGNYYDYSTGQYSSSLTGKVYNTAPVVSYAPAVAPYAPVVAASSPYYYAAAPYAAHYASPYTWY